MLHLYTVGQTTLKCGKRISVNFVEMEKPSSRWLQCSRCFQEEKDKGALDATSFSLVQWRLFNSSSVPVKFGPAQTFWTNS